MGKGGPPALFHSSAMPRSPAPLEIDPLRSLRLLVRFIAFLADVHGPGGGEVAVALTDPLPPMAAI